MDEQEAVNQPVEQTAPVESAPTETETAPTQQTPVEESSQPERKVSESVPYDRFAEVNAEKQQLKAELEAMRAQQAPGYQPVQPPAPQMPPQAAFDPETAAALDHFIATREQQRKANDFARTHQKELEDPLLFSVVKTNIETQTASQGYADFDKALNDAKAMLDARLKPQVKEAAKEALEEGQQLARKKYEAGAVGETNTPNPQVDPDRLGAKDYAAFYGLSRAD